jgi:hypothetical protein
MGSPWRAVARDARHAEASRLASSNHCGMLSSTISSPLPKADRRNPGSPHNGPRTRTGTGSSPSRPRASAWRNPRPLSRAAQVPRLSSLCLVAVTTQVHVSSIIGGGWGSRGASDRRCGHVSERDIRHAQPGALGHMSIARPRAGRGGAVTPGGASLGHPSCLNITFADDPTLPDEDVAAGRPLPAEHRHREVPRRLPIHRMPRGARAAQRRRPTARAAPQTGAVGRAGEAGRAPHGRVTDGTGR